ncbi:MAG TPA: DUF2252 family protein [Polyangiaceae bacterium]|nr:DUF2252 family protein [Polyangiaceae bacterium]
MGTKGDRKPASGAAIQKTSIHEATAEYETWLAKHIPLVERDLANKHAQMAGDPFRFLRATFYRWMQCWAEGDEALQKGPSVLSVGDLHVENFGTWRDAEGRLIWGVNDFDEAYTLPWTQDLVRLATSARLAIAEQSFTVSGSEACRAILAGYLQALSEGGRPFVLAEENGFLRRVAATNLRDPKRFWKKLSGFDQADEVPKSAARRINAALPDQRLVCRWVSRVSGLGSLGRQRFVGIADWNGGLVAREAKRQAPPASAWALGVRSSKTYGARLLESAVRIPDPFLHIGNDWIVRRLAPDCVRIDSRELPAKRDQNRLLWAMGYETGNVHLGTAKVNDIVADASARNPDWLERASRDFAERVGNDWKAWTK